MQSLFFESQLAFEFSSAGLSRIKDAVEQLKEEGRINDNVVAFLNCVVSIYEEAMQMMKEIVAHYNNDDKGNDGDSSKAFSVLVGKFTHAHCFLNEKFTRLRELDPEIYTRLTGKTVSNEG